MSNFPEKLTEIVKALDENDQEKVLNLIREMLDSSDFVLTRPARAELTLMKACAYSSLNEDKPAEKGFTESIDLFKQSLMEIHQLRAGLFYSRFLLKSGRLTDAENLLGKLGTRSITDNDPYLSSLFAFCMAELRYFQLQSGKITSERFFDELEKLQKHLSLLEYPCLDCESMFYIAGNFNPLDILLEIYYKANDVKRTLPLIQTLKSKKTRTRMLLQNAFWQMIDPQEINHLQKHASHLSSELVTYSDLLFMSYPFLDEFKYSYKHLVGKPLEFFGEVKNGLEKLCMVKVDRSQLEPKMKATRKALASAHQEYIKYVENAALVSPVNSYFFTQSISHISQIMAQIDDKTLILDYYISDRNTYVSIINKKEIKIHRLETGRNVLIPLIVKLKEAGGSIGDGSSGSTLIEKIQAELYKILVQPLSAEFEGMKKVIFIPHDCLFNVPFSTLRNETNYLWEIYEVSLLPSIIHLQKYSMNPEIIINKNAIVKVSEIKKDVSDADQSAKKWKIESVSFDSPLDEAGKKEIPTRSLGSSDFAFITNGFNGGNLEDDCFHLFADSGLPASHSTYPEEVKFPGIMLMPGVKYPVQRTPLQEMNEIEILSNLAFFLRTDLLVVNLWNVSDKIRDRFISIFQSELKQKKVIDAFNRSRRRLWEESGRDNSLYSVFQLFGYNLDLEIVSGGEIDLGENATITKIMKPKKKLLATPIINEGILFTGGEDTSIHGINAADGSGLWSIKTMDWVNNSFTYNDGTVFVGTMDKRVFSITGRTGRKNWEFKTGGWIADSPQVNNEYVFAVSKDGYVYFLQRENGVMKKRHFIGDVTRAETYLHGDILFVVNEHRDKRKFHCFDVKRHNLMWEKVIPFKGLGRGCLSNGQYCSVDERGLLETISVYNGKSGGKLKSNIRFSDKVLYHNGFAYMEKADGEIHAFSLDSNELAWTVKPPSKNTATLINYRNLICVYCSDNFLYGYDRRTGEMKLKVLIGKLPAKQLISDENDIYLFDNEQGIYNVKFRKTGSILKSKSEIKNRLNTTSGIFSAARIDRVGTFPKDSSTANKPIAAAPAPPTSAASSKSLESDEKILAEPILVNDAVLLSKSSKTLELVNIHTFSPVWKAELKDTVKHPSLFYNGVIIAGSTDGYLYTLHSKSGKILAANKITPSITSPFAASYKHIYFGSSDKHFYCTSFYQAKIKWKHKTGGIVSARPVLHEKNVIFASSDGYIYCMNLETGESIWQQKSFSPDFHHLVLADGILYAAGTDSYIYCLNPVDGKILWKFFCLGENITTEPLITSRLIVLATNRGTVFILSRRDGNLIRKVRIGELCTVRPVEYGSHFVLGTERGHILFIDSNSGQVVKSLEVKASIKYPFMILGNGILLVEGRKSLTAISLEKEKIARVVEPEIAAPRTQEVPETIESQEKINKNLSDERQEQEESKRPTIKNLSPNVRRTGSSESVGAISKPADSFIPIAILMLFGFSGLTAFSVITKNVPLMIFSIFSLLVSGTFVVVFKLQDENVKMKKLFNRFVPSHLLDKFVNEGKTEEKEITVLFMDLYDYTTISEAISNKDLFELLKKIDSLTDRIVTLYKGEIMSYIGDAYMITFNAVNNVPDHPQKAISVALEINREVEKLSNLLKIPGQGDIPLKLKMGFGIHTGQALVGIRGGENKLEPFVLGDTANIASRLQALTRDFQCDVIVSGETRKRIPGMKSLKNLGKSRVKGKSEPIEIYTIGQPKAVSR